MLIVAIGLLYLYGILGGLQCIIMNMVLGYFYADIRIVYKHFLMDNYDEHSSGFKHHAAVAKSGFHELEDVKDESCTPRCWPCDPCNPCDPCDPKRAFNSNSKQLMNMRRGWTLWTAVYIISPCSPLPSFGVIFMMLELMNELSGAGLPDYWSHHRDKAPYLAKVAQNFRLMMLESDHYKHYVNPNIGNAYFSPLTNFVLDTIRFWDFTKWIMLEIYNKQPLTIPAMSKH